MANEYVNHVIVNGSAIIDLRSDTVDAAHLAQGYTAHDASGAPITGELSGGGSFPPATITAGDTPVMVSTDFAKATSTSSLTSLGISLTIPAGRAGTYRFKTTVFNHMASGSKTSAVRFYKNSTAVGTEQSVAVNTGMVYSQDIACAAGDTITVYAKAASTVYGTYAFGLSAYVNGDNGFV